jgi:hypothetical protein
LYQSERNLSVSRLQSNPRVLTQKTKRKNFVFFFYFDKKIKNKIPRSNLHLSFPEASQASPNEKKQKPMENLQNT